jgi:hypothetical protein
MFSAFAGLLGSYIEARAIKKVSGELGDYLDRWARLIASVLITVLVVFPTTWGTAGLGALAKGSDRWTALVFGFLTALVTTGLIVYQLWLRSPLTKGIAIAVPSSLQKAALEQDVTLTERR